jgi:tRNA(fMet)-specific endonuclease VapC
MRWMLDTDTCIALIKKNASALKKLRGKSIGQVGISSITLGELAFGASKSVRSAEAHVALGEFLLALEVAPFDEQAAMCYGAVRASLAQRGKSIGPLDTMIAGHAIATDVILVTHNTREFVRVEQLRVEDWLKGG